MDTIYNVKDMEMAIAAGCKSRDEEIKNLREIIECKDILLIAYRLGTNRGVSRALDRLAVLKDSE